MRVITADIWNYWDRSAPDVYLVIPSNVGWREDGSNVMGAGLAREAARRFPELAADYGRYCQRSCWRGALGDPDSVPLYVDERRKLILFAVKPLNKRAPHLSWRGRASLGLIASSAAELAALHGLHGRPGIAPPILLPLVGCGNGKLNPRDVLPILRKHLTGDNFTLVLPLGTTAAQLEAWGVERGV